MLLPDINVWLAMAFDGHESHSVAKKWFDALSTGTCNFCRMTQQGFLRMATNPKAFGTNSLTLVGAWQAYDAFRSDPRMAYCEEPANVETVWRTFTGGKTFSPHVWNDAYLAAFAISANLEIVTFDKGFRKFEGLPCTILS
jgi:uncharacterized protein